MFNGPQRYTFVSRTAAPSGHWDWPDRESKSHHYLDRKPKSRAGLDRRDELLRAACDEVGVSTGTDEAVTGFNKRPDALRGEAIVTQPRFTPCAAELAGTVPSAKNLPEPA